jgi:hypothetical protein
MVTFSADPKKAEQEMHAIIFYLTTFGYIDGDFDAAEKSFVRDYIRKLIEQRADSAMKGADAKLRAEVVDKYTKHFHEVFEGIDKNVKDLFTESVGQNEDPTAFVHAKLKVKCFEIFKSFDHRSQEQLMHTIDELLMADGTAHPAELKFRGELAALLESHDEVVELVEEETALPSVTVHEPKASKAEGANHPFFFPAESHYSRDPSKIQAQINADLSLVNRVMSIWDEQRKLGAGKLKGKHNVQELAGEPAFLDGNVYSLMPKPGETYELTVLGDLHGCYSVFKAALLQSKFFERVDAWRKSPTTQPHPKLVLLGDYIDRGLFSLNGVLRTVLQLFATAPEHVYVLRGNHEYYIEFKGTMYGGVKPAEAINTLKPHLPVDVFRRYRECFEQMPNMLLFDRMLFVHGGIARDRLIKERVKDLSGLNDPDVRFQMMWSDPSTADVIPADLQDAASRFAFGRMQFRAFMQKIGCHTMIRGHEKVESGFVKTYDDEHYKLFTLFSAGGKDNGDLPADSSYRSVTPMALTITLGPNGTTIVPWAPDYKTYNDPSRNAFFRMPPEIEFKP